MATVLHRRDIIRDGDEVVTASPGTGVLGLLARLVYVVSGVIIALLLFRFVLTLFGANPNNAFADFIYSASHPFASPFFGLFGYTPQIGTARFELETLIAAAVYAIVAWLLVRLLTLGSSRYAE